MQRVTRRRGIFRPVVLIEGITAPSSGNCNASYSWEHALEKSCLSSAKSSGECENVNKPVFMPVEAFNDPPLGNFLHALKPGIKVEIRLHDYDDVFAGVFKQAYWIATILKICGYRLLVRYEGRDNVDDEHYDFWVNLGSDEVKHVSYSTQPENCVLLPPTSIRDRHEDWSSYLFNKLASCSTLSKNWDMERAAALMSCRFPVGTRLELLDQLESTRVRPALVIKQLGRRVLVIVSKGDAPAMCFAAETDTQVNGGIWLDQSSCLLFPVGWAKVHGYGLASTEEYGKHCESIAKAIREGQSPPYQKYDATPEKFDDWRLNENTVGVQENLVHWEEGMKMECLDPLNSYFLEFRVATCLQVFGDGYIKVGFDGEEILEETIPFHSTSTNLFPVGYAKTYNIALRGPDDDMEFVWDRYLEEQGAKPADPALFNPIPPDERMKKFVIGGRLESVDLCEPNLICPASLVGIKGRLLQIHFDGWDDNMDQLMDSQSRDIFPLGWCEMYGYSLQHPPLDRLSGNSSSGTTSEIPEKKKRTE